MQLIDDMAVNRMRHRSWSYRYIQLQKVLVTESVEDVPFQKGKMQDSKRKKEEFAVP